MPSAEPTSFEPLTWAAREQLLLAPYAMHSVDSQGRKHAESAHDYRGPYQRDRDRVIHSAAYRRLSGKTQVFTGEGSDYHRTRLTHTHEVASVARTLGRALGLNEDLVETLALMHDLGHPPFGHSGEDVLDECLHDVGGFSHNIQGLRVVELLETRYADFPGLNLSHEVLISQGFRADKTGENELRPLLEAQVVDAADSVAYDTHDADDALEHELLTLDDLLQTVLWSEAAKRVGRQFTNLLPGELRRAILHELIDWQVGDLISQASQRLANIDSAEAARQAPLVIHGSPELADKKTELEKFLYQRVYRHPEVITHRTRAQGYLREMFAIFVAEPDLMPKHFRARVLPLGLKRTVGDYLAGMTDRYARREYERLTKQAAS